MVGAPEVDAAERDPSVGARLDGQVHVRDEPGAGQGDAHGVPGDARPEVDHVAGLDQADAAGADRGPLLAQVPLAQGRRDLLRCRVPRDQRHIDLGEGVGLAVEAARVRADHGDVHQDAGNVDEPGRDATGPHDLLDLGDDDAAVVVDGLGDRQGVEDRGVVVLAHVAAGIHPGAADNGDVNGEGLVPQVLLAVELDDVDVLGGGDTAPRPLVEAAAVQARVHEGAQADC